MGLAEVIKDLNKKYKSGIVNVGVVFADVDRIPFSSPRLNYMTYGGIPIGRIVEFCGDEGSGKTTTALDIVTNAQRLFPDKKVAYIDVERTLDVEWAKKLGVDVDSLVLVSPDEQTAEQIFEIVKSIVETGEISLCVIDSLGVMVSAQAYSKSIEDRTYGGISQSLTLFSKEMIPICAREKCTLIGINQMRDDMNSTYGGSTTTGGRAWRHNCSLRMEFRKSNFIDDKGNPVSNSVESPAGHFVKAALIKSKICKLDRKVGFYTLRYLSGIDYISDLIEVGMYMNAIDQSGSWYSLIDTSTGEVEFKVQGKAALHEYLETNKPALDKLNAFVNEKSL